MPRRPGLDFADGGILRSQLRPQPGAGGIVQFLCQYRERLGTHLDRDPGVGLEVVPGRLIVCCDGTWNTADQAISGHPSPTNVTKLALSIAPEDAAGARQCVYYHSGVGTSRWKRLSGGAFGVGLSRNVLDAYHFLVDNYESGDLLYLFGFSRGAFTARSLAGLIRNSGILRRENADRIDQAWALYRSAADTPSGVASTLFRRAYSYEPRIQLIGVWDTVGALGVPALGPRWLKPIVTRINHRWEFHDTKLSTRVKGAFHALAIDEQRAAFAPALWHQQPGADGQELSRCGSPGCTATSAAATPTHPCLTSRCCGWRPGARVRPGVRAWRLER